MECRTARDDAQMAGYLPTKRESAQSIEPPKAGPSAIVARVVRATECHTPDVADSASRYLAHSDIRSGEGTNSAWEFSD